VGAVIGRPKIALASSRSWAGAACRARSSGAATVTQGARKTPMFSFRVVR
jgi:hypothetical protein